MNKNGKIGYFVGCFFIFMAVVNMIIDFSGGVDANKILEQLMKIRWYLPLGFGATIMCMQHCTNVIVEAIKGR